MITTAQIARWFAASRKLRPIDAVRLADQVVIRHSLKPEKPQSPQLLIPLK